MSDSAPFQVTDPIYKDLIEGNRFSVAEIFTDANASDINILVEAGQSNGGYIIFSPVKVTTTERLDVRFVFNPDVSDTGTQIDITRRRVDGPSSSSAAYKDTTFTNGQSTGDILVLSGTNKVGSNIDNKALIVPDGTDVLLNIVGLSGGANNVDVGFEISWSEVPDTIIPDLT